jgi:hypothetical protein
MSPSLTAPDEFYGDLTSQQVIDLWNSLSFHMQQYGQVMTVHIVILWRDLGVTDHDTARSLLTLYLNRCQKWSRVGWNVPETDPKWLRRNRGLRRPPETVAGRRFPQSLRTSRLGQGFLFRYVFTHENGTARGFHSHILANVPPELKPDFEAFSRRTLEQLAGHEGAPRTAVKVRRSYAKTEEAAVKLQWRWFRYISKQLPPEPGLCFGFRGEPERQLRDVLKLSPYQSSLPVTIAGDRMTGASEELRKTAQREAGFISTLTKGDLTEIYEGHELAAYRNRQIHNQFAEMPFHPVQPPSPPPRGPRHKRRKPNFALIDSEDLTPEVLAYLPILEAEIQNNPSLYSGSPLVGLGVLQDQLIWTHRSLFQRSALEKLGIRVKFCHYKPP